MEEMFCPRLRPEIKFVLPSLYRAENALCCHQQPPKRADIIDPKHLQHSFTLIRQPTFCISKPLNLTRQFIVKYGVYIAYIRIVVHETIFLV